MFTHNECNTLRCSQDARFLAYFGTVVYKFRHTRPWKQTAPLPFMISGPQQSQLLFVLLKIVDREDVIRTTFHAKNDPDLGLTSLDNVEVHLLAQPLVRISPGLTWDCGSNCVRMLFTNVKKAECAQTMAINGGLPTNEHSILRGCFHRHHHKAASLHYCQWDRRLQKKEALCCKVKWRHRDRCPHIHCC